ncbi:MAG: MFS transporter, partial [bacterium]|nr:MFS transporter [bacterium]
MVIGLAIGSGSLVSSLLVAVHPVSGIDPLVTPLVAVLALRAIEFGAIARLVTERRAEAGRGDWRGAVSEVPAVVAGAIGAVRGSRVLMSLVLVDFLWGFGMMAFEVFTPAKLGTVVDGADRAAALLGPTSTAAWLVAAGGAALIPLLSRRWGPGPTGAALRVAQGLTVLG